MKSLWIKEAWGLSLHVFSTALLWEFEKLNCCTRWSLKDPSLISYTEESRLQRDRIRSMQKGKGQQERERNHDFHSFCWRDKAQAGLQLNRAEDWNLRTLSARLWEASIPLPSSRLPRVVRAGYSRSCSNLVACQSLKDICASLE